MSRQFSGLAPMAWFFSLIVRQTFHLLTYWAENTGTSAEDSSEEEEEEKGEGEDDSGEQQLWTV